LGTTAHSVGIKFYPATILPRGSGVFLIQKERERERERKRERGRLTKLTALMMMM
jgi:hypothetical protein